MKDILFAARMLNGNPGFSAIIVVTLGLGIGLNTAIFTNINAVLLRPLPLSRAEAIGRRAKGLEVSVSRQRRGFWLHGC